MFFVFGLRFHYEEGQSVSFTIAQDIARTRGRRGGNLGSAGEGAKQLKLEGEPMKNNNSSSKTAR